MEFRIILNVITQDEIVLVLRIPWVYILKHLVEREVEQEVAADGDGRVCEVEQLREVVRSLDLGHKEELKDVLDQEEQVQHTEHIYNTEHAHYKRD